jgi:hypothetical protein
VRVLDRGSPHLPPHDQSAAEQELDQLQVEGSAALETVRAIKRGLDKRNAEVSDDRLKDSRTSADFSSAA